MSKYIGIDIAKQTFDGYGLTAEGKKEFVKLYQSRKDFHQLIKRFGKDKTYVMEATGPYYLKLATFPTTGIALLQTLTFLLWIKAQWKEEASNHSTSKVC